MQGRKPLPTALKLIQGNPGKRPIKFDDFRPATAVPSLPRHLKREAKKEWLRITRQLVQYGMISEVDRGVIAMLCTTWGRYVEAELMIEKATKSGSSGLFVKTPNGFPVQSPWLAVSNKAIETYRALCGEFGLTPASRTRVTPSDGQLGLPGLEAEPPKTGWGSV